MQSLFASKHAVIEMWIEKNSEWCCCLLEIFFKDTRDNLENIRTEFF